MGLRTAAIVALLFGSGLTALLYQTAWQRMLRLVFGASTAASAAVLAVFLGGLGLGGAWLGRRAERSSRPLALYGLLEIGVALFAALSPLFVWLAARLYFGLGGSAVLGPSGANALRIALAVFIVGPAAVLMGGTLPAAVRAIEVPEDTGRSRTALLYGINTTGAVAGALLGTFLLFEYTGTRLTVYLAALLNLIVGGAALLVARGTPRLPVEPRAGASPSVTASDASAPPAFVYFAAATVGFVFLCLELVWYRMLAPVLGGTSFTFGLVLAVALAGIGTGGFVYWMRNATRVGTLTAFAITLGLEALAVVVPWYLGDSIAMLAAYVRPAAAAGFPWLVASWAVIAGIVVFPAALVAGYQFPLLVALLGQGREQVARQLGLTYAFNTLGSIIGALAGAFLLIPSLGATSTWRAMALVLVALALAAALLHLSHSGARQLRAVGAAALFAFVTIVLASGTGPTAIWRHSPIGAGRVDLTGLGRNELKEWMISRERRLLWQRDGVESAVAADVANGVSFLVNGKSDGSVSMDRGTQGMLALLPVILHHDPRHVFVLGLGTGMSAGWAAASPDVERVDVAELEPAVLEVARLCSPANRRVLEQKKTRIHLGDGREYLLTTRERYDVIASEPSNPYRAGVASLFTREFYQAAEQRLKPRGYFAQWVQAYEIDVATLRMVLRTMTSVFPVIEIWQTQPDDLLLIASREPRTYQMGLVRQRARSEPYREALRRFWLSEDAEAVLAHSVMNARMTTELVRAAPGPINTDDNSLLEYSFARNVGISHEPLGLRLLELSLARGSTEPQISGHLDRARVAELRPRGWFISEERAPDLEYPEQVDRIRLGAVEEGCLGTVSAVPTEWDAEDAAPRDIVEIFVLGQAYAHVRDERALPLADELQSAGFGAEAELVRARYEIASGQVSAAFDALVRSVGRLRLEAPTLCQTASEVLRLMKHVAHGRPEYAEAAVDVLLEAPFAGYVEEDFRITTAQRLAFDLEPVEPCLRALRADRTIRWERAYLAARYSCLLRAQHHRAAEAARDQAEYQANTTGDVAEGLPPGSGGSTATGAGTTVRPSDASSRAGAPPSEEPSTGPLR